MHHVLKIAAELQIWLAKLAADSTSGEENPKKLLKPEQILI
jgi:hypothetical protein